MNDLDLDLYCEDEDGAVEGKVIYNHVYSSEAL